MRPDRVVLLAVRLNVFKGDLVRVIELTNTVLKQETVMQSSTVYGRILEAFDLPSDQT